MRFSQLLSGASLFALFSFVTASDVINLTAENFDSVVNPEELILVEFFAPWCGHCKALAPHYEEAATSLKEKGIKLAKVNCVDEADFCQSNGVQGYPYVAAFLPRSAFELTSCAIAPFVSTARVSSSTTLALVRRMESSAT